MDCDEEIPDSLSSQSFSSPDSISLLANMTDVSNPSKSVEYTVQQKEGVTPLAADSQETCISEGESPATSPVIPVQDSLTKASNFQANVPMKHCQATPTNQQNHTLAPENANVQPNGTIAAEESVSRTENSNTIHYSSTPNIELLEIKIATLKNDIFLNSCQKSDADLAAEECAIKDLIKAIALNNKKEKENLINMRKQGMNISKDVLNKLARCHRRLVLLVQQQSALSKNIKQIAQERVTDEDRMSVTESSRSLLQLSDGLHGGNNLDNMSALFPTKSCSSVSSPHENPICSGKVTSSKSQVTSILKKTVATDEVTHAQKKFVKFAIPFKIDNSGVMYEAYRIDSSMEVDVATKLISTMKTSQDTTTSATVSLMNTSVNLHHNEGMIIDLTKVATTNVSPSKPMISVNRMVQQSTSSAKVPTANVSLSKRMTSVSQMVQQSTIPTKNVSRSRAMTSVSHVAQQLPASTELQYLHHKGRMVIDLAKVPTTNVSPSKPMTSVSRMVQQSTPSAKVPTASVSRSKPMTAVSQWVQQLPSSAELPTANVSKSKPMTSSSLMVQQLPSSAKFATANVSRSKAMTSVSHVAQQSTASASQVVQQLPSSAHFPTANVSQSRPMTSVSHVVQQSTASASHVVQQLPSSAKFPTANVSRSKPMTSVSHVVQQLPASASCMVQQLRSSAQFPAANVSQSKPMTSLSHVVQQSTASASQVVQQLPASASQVVQQLPASASQVVQQLPALASQVVQQLPASANVSQSKPMPSVSHLVQHATSPAKVPTANVSLSKPMTSIGRVVQRLLASAKVPTANASRSKPMTSVSQVVPRSTPSLEDNSQRCWDESQTHQASLVREGNVVAQQSTANVSLSKPMTSVGRLVQQPTASVLDNSQMCCDESEDSISLISGVSGFESRPQFPNRLGSQNKKLNPVAFRKEVRPSCTIWSFDTQRPSQDLPPPTNLVVNDLLKLSELINRQLIIPGRDVLQCSVMGQTHQASVLGCGSIVGPHGITFHSPMIWMRGLTGVKNVSRLRAYRSITHKGQTLYDMCANIKVSNLKAAGASGRILTKVQSNAKEPFNQAPPNTMMCSSCMAPIQAMDSQNYSRRQPMNVNRYPATTTGVGTSRFNAALARDNNIPQMKSKIKPPSEKDIFNGKCKVRLVPDNELFLIEDIFPGYDWDSNEVPKEVYKLLL